MATTLKGRLNKLYRDTSGTPASPTWVEAKKIGDLTLTLEKELADAANRDGNGWQEDVTVWTKCSLSFEIFWKPDTDVHCLAFWEAFHAETEVHLKVTDGNPGGERGVRFIVQVSKAELQGPLKGIQKLAVTVQPCPSDLPPSKVG